MSVAQASARKGRSGDWLTLARHAAGRGGEGEEAELLRELLSFRLATASYAIPVERVREIVRLREITPMPRVPDFVKGVVALRGEIVQVVDMRMCLGIESREPTRTSRIIVLHGDEQRVTGVLVDAVQEVMRVPESEITVSSSGDAGMVPELCTRGDEFVSIVDMDRVLEDGASDSDDGD
ncbi:MAG: chemotaxis protein CheW [Deltaproteobacteria bacterium]|nr:chemotaxis protein CheW [Deltaproteobacteria bacterium]MBW2419939.1 chemotaxis protein CheW [Deltaproteobacteria bacterium]